MSEPIRMPFGGWVLWAQGAVYYVGSKSNEAIRGREVWQDSDAASYKFFWPLVNLNMFIDHSLFFVHVVIYLFHIFIYWLYERR